ncbi:MAG: autotransporter outer membrane beta-barrel domain-containing protein [Gammaproteobacteria bacterium]
MRQLNFKFLVALGALTLSAVQSVYAQSIEEVIADQRSRQIARQISDNIERRISSDIDETFKSSNLESASLSSNNPLAASSDANPWMPDSVWSSFSWSRISNDGNKFGADFDADVYQDTTGVDKKWNDFYFGLSLTYAYSTTGDINFGFSSFESQTHSVTLTPYLAYVINDNFFISALTSYSYSNDNPRATFSSLPESEQDSYITEIDMNGLKVVDNWFFKGKIGARYQHSHTKTDAAFFSPATRDNNDSWTYLVDSEAGYSFGNGIRVFTGVLFEYNNPKPSQGLADGVFYYSAGMDYSVTKAFSLGLKAQTDLTNEDIDLTTVALNARLAL